MHTFFCRRGFATGLLFSLGLAMSSLTSPVDAEEPRPRDFRVKTDVFVESERAPRAENLTLYTEHAVYDFDLKGGETTILEPALGRFVLLDPKRRLKAEMPLQSLGKFVADVQANGIKKNPQLYDPKFQKEYEAARRTVELTSPAMIYQAVGALPPKSHADAVSRFLQFTDWTARLNTTVRHSFPPFGRLVLNSELAERKLIPEEIELVFINTADPSQRAKFRSKQAFTWELTGQDQRRLDEVRQQMAQFKMVQWAEYRPLEQE